MCPWTPVENPPNISLKGHAELGRPHLGWVSSARMLQLRPGQCATGHDGGVGGQPWVLAGLLRNPCICNRWPFSSARGSGARVTLGSCHQSVRAEPSGPRVQNSHGRGLLEDPNLPVTPTLAVGSDPHTAWRVVWKLLSRSSHRQHRPACQDASCHATSHTWVKHQLQKPRPSRLQLRPAPARPRPWMQRPSPPSGNSQQS